MFQKKIPLFCLVSVLFSCSLIFCAEEPLPIPLSGHAESGIFRIYKNESPIGTIVYTLTEEGNYTRKFTISMAGQEVEYDLQIQSDGQGHWTEMQIVTPAETTTAKRLQGEAHYTNKSDGKTYKVALKDKLFLYENYGPVFQSIMIRHYDMEKKGKQTLPIFIAPVAVMDVFLEYKGEETRRIGEWKIRFCRFDFTIAGILIEIWADRHGKIYFMNVPMQYAAYVREGYEEMLAMGAEDSLTSKPEFEVRKETVMITMRDRVKLATDLYFPLEGKGKFPVVLVRTPYKKEMEQLKGEYYARRGYVAAIQDCRGRFSSEGKWNPFFQEPQDGYDTIEWLGTREWSSGKVGMIGASYVGWVQLWAAAAKPPHLTTVIPNVAPPDPFYNIPYEYGTFFILGSIWWAEILETEATGDLSGKAMAGINDRKYEKILKTLPVIELDKEIFGKENYYWRKWIEHNTNDSYWEPANFMDKLTKVDLPVFLQSGWFDGDGIGSKLNYKALSRSISKHIKLVLGPWGHTAESSSRIGEYDFGREAAPDLQSMYLRWFDYWLKGIENKILEEPLVQVFVMHSNKWLKGNRYPLPKTRFKELYLSSTKGANTSRGDGKLSLVMPDGGMSFDEYTYDPGDPTPSPEFYFKSEAEEKAEKEGTIDTKEVERKMIAFHNKVTDERKDILVFQTDPLQHPISIAGPVSAFLYASSSAKDTDWFVTLMDVNKRGKIFNLVHGTLRARFRNSTSKPELLEKDKIYPFTIDMWQTGITFREGHRIRVEISSALFPLFSRNLNTGGHNEMDTEYVSAKQRIYHSREYPSHVLLPVVEVE